MAPRPWALKTVPQTHTAPSRGPRSGKVRSFRFGGLRPFALVEASGCRDDLQIPCFYAAVRDCEKIHCQPRQGGKWLLYQEPPPHSPSPHHLSAPKRQGSGLLRMDGSGLLKTGSLTAKPGPVVTSGLRRLSVRNLVFPYGLVDSLWQKCPEPLFSYGLMDS